MVRPAWELMYLKEKGIDIKAYDSNVDYRWKEIINDHPTAEDILSSMQNDPELNEKVTSLAKHAIIYPTWEKISLEVRRKMYEETGVKASPINPQVRKQTKEIFERDYKSTLLNKDGSPRKKDVKKVVEDIVKEHNDTKKYDFYLSKVKASNYPKHPYTHHPIHYEPPCYRIVSIGQPILSSRNTQENLKDCSYPPEHTEKTCLDEVWKHIHKHPQPLFSAAHS
jgi:hypothetical protein